jgi:hypothetical protein
MNRYEMTQNMENKTGTVIARMNVKTTKLKEKNMKQF